jgi:iron complex transport system substrate-binding protein
MPNRRLIAIFYALVVLSILILAIELHKPQIAERPAPQPTVASITPAGTDLVIGIGAADHLVAVSDLDEDRPGTAGLPRVGDFDHVDWEKLAAAHPKILLTQFGNRTPAGLKERCDELGIQLLDVRLDVLDDVYRESDELGAALNVQVQAEQAAAELKNHLAIIAAAAAAAGPPRQNVALAVSDGGAVGLIGPGTFHGQLLAIAGGVNVAHKFSKPFITVDAELLASLDPVIILDLQPSPPTTPQELEQAKKYWQSMPNVSAVRNNRAIEITQPYCLRPGWHAADLAEIFARQLHPNIQLNYSARP